MDEKSKAKTDKTKKKTKKKEEPKTPEPPPPAPEPEPVVEKAPTPSETPKSHRSGSDRSSRGSRKVQRAGSSVFSMFTQFQVTEFREGFRLMDHDGDGIIGAEDLAFVFDQVGKLVDEGEIQALLEEVPAPLNFTTMLHMFADHMSQGSDPEDVIAKAMSSFDVGNGKIDGESFRHALENFDEKFTHKECNILFDHFYIDDNGKIDIASLINMLTGKDEEEA